MTDHTESDAHLDALDTKLTEAMHHSDKLIDASNDLSRKHLREIIDIDGGLDAARTTVRHMRSDRHRARKTAARKGSDDG